MKKFLLFLLAFVPALVLTSCTDDDLPTPVPFSYNTLWTLQSSGTTRTLAVNDNATATEYVLQADGSAGIYQFTTFEADGVLTATLTRFKTKTAGGEWTEWQFPMTDDTRTYLVSGTTLQQEGTDADGTTHLAGYQKTQSFPADAPADVNDIADWEF